MLSVIGVLPTPPFELAMVKATPRGDCLSIGSTPGMVMPERAVKLHSAAGEGERAFGWSSFSSHCRQVRDSTKAILAARGTLIFAFKRAFLRRRRCLLFILGNLVLLSSCRALEVTQGGGAKK